MSPDVRIVGSPIARIPLHELNGPQNSFVRFEDSWVGAPALELIRQAVQKHSDRIACDDGRFPLSYRQIWAAAEGIAALLGRDGDNGAVGLLLPNDSLYPAAVLACMAVQRPCIMIDRHHPPDRIGAIIRDAGLRTVVLRRTDVGSDLLPDGLYTVVVEDALPVGELTNLERPAVDSPDRPSFIVYTSGSTGQPKGIALSQRGVLHRASELINSAHVTPDDKILSLASPSTIGGLQQIFEAMICGATLFKLDLQRMSLEHVVKVVEDRRITMMFSTPAVWRSVARIPGAKKSLASLRIIQTSGDALLRVDLEAVRAVLPADCHVLSVYGATEVPAVLQWFIPHGLPDDGPRIAAGYALPDIELLLEDEQTPGVGDLAVRSRWTALGLWQEGKLKPGSFEFDEADPSLRLYRTGDLVERRPDGLFVFLGRKDRQIKIRGNRIELAEIESALRRHPDVADAAVVARRVDGEPRLWAFVVPAQSDFADLAAAVRSSLRRSLPAYMRPTLVQSVPELPLLPGRKVDEAALIASVPRVTDGDAAESDHRWQQASPRASTLVAQAWRRTFGRRPPAGDQTFDELSGDSLRLLQLVFHLERAAGVSLPLEDFHGELRPSEFALELDRHLSVAGSRSTSGLPVVFFMPGYGGDEPRLGRFRAACEGLVDIRPLRYPDLTVLAAEGTHFDTFIAEGVRQINGSGYTGPVVLAGYSVGGDVAYGIAHSLATQGTPVSRLCIFDTEAEGLAAGPIARSGPRLSRLERLRQIVRRGDWNELIAAVLPARRLVRQPLLSAVRWLGPLDRIVTANLTFYLKRHFHESLVLKHHAAWRERRVVQRLATPVVLFRSDEARLASDDLGWRSRADEVRIVPVAGDHFSMFGPDNVAVLARQLRHAAEEACESRSRTTFR